jgi:hypothetical protein
MHNPHGRLLHIGTLRRFFARPRRRHPNPGTAAVLRGGHGTAMIAFDVRRWHFRDINRQRQDGRLRARRGSSRAAYRSGEN